MGAWRLKNLSDVKNTNELECVVLLQENASEWKKMLRIIPV
jgi:hypothetical protein